MQICGAAAGCLSHRLFRHEAALLKTHSEIFCAVGPCEEQRDFSTALIEQIIQLHRYNLNRLDVEGVLPRKLFLAG